VLDQMTTLPSGIERRDRRVLLDGQVRVALVEERVLEDVIGVFEPGIDVAEVEGDTLVDVAFSRRIRECARRRCTRAPRPGIDRRQELVRRRRSHRALRTRSASSARHDRRHGIADEAHLFEHRAPARPG
jgi:hypothetical protein